MFIGRNSDFETFLGQPNLACVPEAAQRACGATLIRDRWGPERST